MLKKIAFENFYSFKERVEISFDDTNINDRYRNVFAVFGHNASGKTNLLRALHFIKWLAYNSWQRKDPGSKIPVKTFFSNDKPINFLIEFIINEKNYKYEVSLTEEMILAESLSIKTGEERKTFSNLFNREINKSNKKDHLYIYSKLNLPNVNKENLENNVRTDSTVLSYLRQFPNREEADFLIFFDNFISNATAASVGRMELEQATDIYNSNANYLNEIINFLKRNDYGIDDIELKEEKREILSKETGIKNMEKTYIPIFKHWLDRKKHTLPYTLESEGTLTIFKYFPLILKTLETGGILILDEFDTSIHPIMIERIFNYFANSNNNPHEAQLIISTHCLESMNVLSKNNIILTEKDNLASTAYKLSDIAGIRESDNFYKKYMSGAYGAIAN